MEGLHTSWNLGTIYCSPTTRKAVLFYYPKINQNRVVRKKNEKRMDSLAHVSCYHINYDNNKNSSLDFSRSER